MVVVLTLIAGLLFVDSLDERERRAIELRYGIVNARQHTLQEIGQCLGISRERVRQIEKQAMEQLMDHDVELPWKVRCEASHRQ